MTQLHITVLNTSNFILNFQRKGNARSVVHFDGVVPKATPCVAYAPIDVDEQVGIMVDGSLEAYKLENFVECLNVWLLMNMALASSPHFVREHMTSVMVSGTARRNVARTNTITCTQPQPRALESRLNFKFGFNSGFRGARVFLYTIRALSQQRRTSTELND